MAQRERSRRFYWANRERVLAKAAARRGKTRQSERPTCSECGKPLVGQQRVTCGLRVCKDARFKRTNPEGYAARERRKVVRRRVRRQAGAS